MVNSKVNQLVKKMHFLIQTRQADKALQVINSIIQLEPHKSFGYFEKGRIQTILGQYQDAENNLRMAIKIDPHQESYFIALANLLIENSKASEAVIPLEEALKINPKSHNATYYLGLAFKKLNSLSDALQCFDISLSLNPQFHFAYVGKAEVLMKMDNYVGALNTLQDAHATVKKPTSQSLNLLGICNLYLQKNKEAREQFIKALALYPKDIATLINLSGICCSEKDFEAGEQYAIRGLALNPNSLSCLNNLGNIYLEQGKSDLAFAQFKKAIELNPNNFSIFSNLLYCSNLLSDLPKEILFDYHCQFGKVLMDFTKNRYPQISLKNSLEVNRKLKIGFVSADLRDHAVVNFMEPIFANLDQSKFHLTAFSNSGIIDSTTDRIKNYFSDWHQVLMMNDYDLAQLIAKLEIDILFDLSGHTAHNRLPVFAMSPAPIQMTWIGYPCTTGLKTMDYVLFEAQTPDGFMDKEYIEKIIYLPMSFPFKPFEPSPSIEPLPALRNGYLTFGVFNSPKKYSSTSINLWIKTLNALPTSKIVFGGVSDSALRKNLLSKFSEKNIGPERISFLDYMPIDKFLIAHQDIDICLDTYPYSGGTTTNHSLWMGVPVLTLRGEKPASRQSSGILNSQGLGKWSCANEDEFIEKARYWDKQLEELGQIRFKIRQNFQFGDSETFKNIVHGFEKALGMAWIRYCNKEAPTTFRV